MDEALINSTAMLTLLGAAGWRILQNVSWSSTLLVLVLLLLGLAVVLHVRFLLHAHGAHRLAASALHATEREYGTVFDGALDGILILDAGGICREANPAALALLGLTRGALVGQPIERFLASDRSTPAWQSTNGHAYEGREGRIARANGETRFVEYTAKTHYLPGRHLVVLRDVSLRKHAETALQESEERFRQMAANVQEVFWMLDAENLEALYVNEAYETITGRSCQSLKDDPKSYEDVIHPEDRTRVLSRLAESAETGQFDEEFRITRPDKAIRWVLVRGFPVRDSTGTVRRLVGTAQDISTRKSAEEHMARNLDLAESARAEAEAFRKTSLALTQNLSMDYVLDTLLQSLLKLVPCESAQIFLIETGTRLFLAREVQNYRSSRSMPPSPGTLDARDNRFLAMVLASKDSLLIPDADADIQWRRFRGFSHLRSWLCVPLVASEQVLGFLSLGDTNAQAFGQEHLRLAKSLAIPAAVAIQNARLYERAEIYGLELQQRLADLEVTQQALRLAEEGRTLSEDRFTAVFRSSPIPFSITTLEEGRFVDVNNAFERRYGYSRDKLIGRTLSEVGPWNHPEERRRVVDEVRERGAAHSLLTRLRKSSGEAIDAIVSAETVQLDGTECLLAIFDDVPAQADTQSARKSPTVP